MGDSSLCYREKLDFLKGPDFLKWPWSRRMSKSETPTANMPIDINRGQTTKPETSSSVICLIVY